MLVWGGLDALQNFPHWEDTSLVPVVSQPTQKVASHLP
jgi:hypothetical protein